MNLLDKINKAMSEYTSQAFAQPDVMYVGDNEARELYKTYGGVLLELLGCEIVVCEKSNWIQFGRKL